MHKILQNKIKQKSIKLTFDEEIEERQWSSPTCPRYSLGWKMFARGFNFFLSLGMKSRLRGFSSWEGYFVLLAYEIKLSTTLFFEFEMGVINLQIANEVLEFLLTVTVQFERFFCQKRFISEMKLIARRPEPLGFRWRPLPPRQPLSILQFKILFERDLK